MRERRKLGQYAGVKKSSNANARFNLWVQSGSPAGKISAKSHTKAANRGNSNTRVISKKLNNGGNCFLKTASHGGLSIEFALTWTVKIKNRARAAQKDLREVVKFDLLCGIQSANKNHARRPGPLDSQIPGKPHGLKRNVTPNGWRVQ